MTLADLALDGSTGLEQPHAPVRRRGRRLIALVALVTVIGLVATAARRQHRHLDAEDSNGS